MRSVALVLGGGSVRGFFHIGVLKALRDLNIKVTEIAGCSAGAIIGAIYASNPEQDLDELIKQVELRKLIQLGSGTSVLGTKKIESYIQELIGCTKFNQLKIPLTVNATDINTGEEVVMDKGDLISAVLASMAVPSIFPLIRRNRRMLCDGGIVNNVPLSNTTKKTVVVSETNLPLLPIHEGARKRDILHNTAFIPLHAKFRNDLNKTKQHVIHIKLGHKINPFDIRKTQIQNLIELGYRATMEQKRAFR